VLAEHLPRRIWGIQRSAAKLRTVTAEDPKIETASALAGTVYVDDCTALGKGRMVTEALQLGVTKAQYGAYDPIRVVNGRRVDEGFDLWRLRDAEPRWIVLRALDNWLTPGSDEDKDERGGSCRQVQIRHERLVPNGPRLSCGRNACGRKVVGPQTKRLAGEATQFFPHERPTASSAC